MSPSTPAKPKPAKSASAKATPAKATVTKSKPAKSPLATAASVKSVAAKAPKTSAPKATAKKPAAPHRTPLCECIVLDVVPGVTPVKAPPVRIFLGTQHAQERAERVFVYSVERFRDPARVYEIYLMRDIAGFDRSGWRTGFTNYRFAIPELAGFVGKAIYNDVDQIYLRDPAELFDLEMGNHGYLAILAKDTSVMLIDCARMAPWWSLESARHKGKKALTDDPAAVPGLWGALDGGWNARDLEYHPEKTGCLHYTTLHLQPWQPTPDDYAYHPNPMGEVWFNLEHEADAICAQVFGPHRPSAGFKAGAAGKDQTAPDISAQGQGFLDDCAGPQRLHVAYGQQPPKGWAGPAIDLALAPDLPTPGPVDGVVVTGLGAALPRVDIPWVLDQLFRWAGRAVYLRVDLASLTADSGPRDPVWWREAMEASAARLPGRSWRLEITGAPGDQVFEARVAAATRVWVLEGKHVGDNAQLHALAKALARTPGWSWESKPLEFNPLHILPPSALGASVATISADTRARLTAPWPDLVIAAGKRSAPVARWVKAQSGGKTRLIQIGRPRARLDAFDLVLTTAQYRLPALPNVMQMLRPLNQMSDAMLTKAAEAWRADLDALPSPLIGVALGGPRWPFSFTAGFARDLAQRLDALAKTDGAGLFITDSPRTPPGFLDAVGQALQSPHRLAHYGAADATLAYPALLALCDRLVVTADSASMLAEAANTGKPVHSIEPPRRDEGGLNPLAWLRKTVARMRDRTGDRGSPRQQTAVGRMITHMVTRGWLVPPRDMRAYVSALERHGLVVPMDRPGDGARVPAPDDHSRAVAVARRVVARAHRLG